MTCICIHVCKAGGHLKNVLFIQSLSFTDIPIVQGSPPGHFPAVMGTNVTCKTGAGFHPKMPLVVYPIITLQFYYLYINLTK